jgi:hypothetical protein
MTAPQGSCACSIDALVAAMQAAGKEVVKKSQLVKGSGSTMFVELSTTEPHIACDVYMAVRVLSGSGIISNQCQLFATVGPNEQLVSLGNFSSGGANPSAQYADGNASTRPQRVCTSRGRAASSYRFRTTFGIGSLIGPTNLWVDVAMIGSDDTSTARGGTWWPPGNFQAAAGDPLLNWDCPVPQEAPLASFSAFDSRTTGATDWLMFFDFNGSAGSPPSNGAIPMRGMVFPLPLSPSGYSRDLSDRDVHFWQGITWALSTTPGTLTLDTGASSLARVDVETA